MQMKCQIFVPKCKRIRGVRANGDFGSIFIDGENR
jgi:hypothetical protein